MRGFKKTKNLRFRDGKWYLDFYSKRESGGFKRIRLYAGRTKEEAKNLLDEVRVKKSYEKMGLRKPEKKADITFEEFIEDFVESHAEGSSIREKTKISHKTSKKALIEFFKGKRLSEIDAEAIEKYKATRRATITKRSKEKAIKQKIKASSINRELSLLGLALRRAVELGYIEKLPKIEKLEEPETKIRILSDDEARRLLEAASPHLKPILSVLLGTGCRKNEALRMKWECPDYETNENESSVVDLKRKLIFIPAGLAKNHKERIVPLNSFLFKMLTEMRATSSSESVFNVRDIKRSFETAYKKAEIKKLNIHALRHTAASRLIRAGVDVVTVSKILGHSDLKITLRYCHSTVETMREAVEKLGRIFGRGRQKVDTSAEKPVAVSSVSLSNLTH